jgi:hydroxyacylglutathione hydrolase
VIQTDAIKKLEDFANNNKQTQGKSTIGDEKARPTPRMHLQG